MFAIIELNGSQVKVEKDTKFTVNHIKDRKSDDPIKVETVLFGKKGNKHYMGTPYVKGAYVECEVLGEKKGPKVVAFKSKHGKSQLFTKGHRQKLTELKVKDIFFE